MRNPPNPPAGKGLARQTIYPLCGADYQILAMSQRRYAQSTKPSRRQGFGPPDYLPLVRASRAQGVIKQYTYVYMISLYLNMYISPHAQLTQKLELVVFCQLGCTMHVITCFTGSGHNYGILFVLIKYYTLLFMISASQSVHVSVNLNENYYIPLKKAAGWKSDF